MAEKKKKEFVKVDNEFIEKVEVGGIEYLKCKGKTEGSVEVYFPCNVSKQDKNGKISVEKWFIDCMA